MSLALSRHTLRNVAFFWGGSTVITQILLFYFFSRCPRFDSPFQGIHSWKGGNPQQMLAHLVTYCSGVERNDS